MCWRGTFGICHEQFCEIKQLRWCSLLSIMCIINIRFLHFVFAIYRYSKVHPSINYDEKSCSSPVTMVTNSPFRCNISFSPSSNVKPRSSVFSGWLKDICCSGANYFLSFNCGGFPHRPIAFGWPWLCSMSSRLINTEHSFIFHVLLLFPISPPLLHSTLWIWHSTN